MNVFGALKTIWKHKEEMTVLVGAAREAQQGKYDLAKQHALAVIEPPLFAAGAAAIAAAVAYVQPIASFASSCFESARTVVDDRACIAAIPWRADIAHLGALAIAGFFAGLRIYYIKPKAKPV